MHRRRETTAAARRGRAALQASGPSVRGSAMTGILARPHCSQAEIAIARQCADFLSRLAASSLTTLRAVATGTIAATPSSVAFCTTRSMRSARAMPCTSVNASGDSARAAAVPATSTSTVSRPKTRDPRGIVLAVAIEERQGIACLEAEDPTDVSRGRAFERDAGACGQRRVDVDADQAHAASTAPLAMPASQSISSGVMT